METAPTSGRPETAYLRRRAASDYLTKVYGMRASEKSLSKWACVGGGPRFMRAGRDVIYSVTDLDEWARAKISAKSFANTAEANAAAKAEAA